MVTTSYEHTKVSEGILELVNQLYEVGVHVLLLVVKKESSQSSSRIVKLRVPLQHALTRQCLALFDFRRLTSDTDLQLICTFPLVFKPPATKLKILLHIYLQLNKWCL